MNGILKKGVDNYIGVPGEWKSRCIRKRTWWFIEKVNQRLREDKEVQGRIRQIQAHPWVRVVEE